MSLMNYQTGFWSSRRSSSGTVSSDTLTNFLNTSGSSHRSSISLPFAEDTIRQNQAEWEHIERIFYGEEPLPADEKTREEFQDWMVTFPYYRLVGKRVNTEQFGGRNPIYHEEVIAIDPDPRRDSQAIHRSNKLMPFSSKSGVVGYRRNNCDNNQRESDHRDDNQLNHIDPGGTLTARPGGLASCSANIFRLPSIKAITNSSYKWSSGTRRTERPPLTSTITLPLLNVDKLQVTFGDLLTTRSISALNSNNKEKEDKDQLRRDRRSITRQLMPQR